ncbi:ATP-binding cassette domain-containing protein [Candidatus Woesebacteria bacterium]|nr:ATP-binding cassette domain-containing protein [Candidatus Woesebacteria bacterium]
MAQIQVSELSKSFSVREKSAQSPSALDSFKKILFPRHVDKKAVEDVSFEIAEGELVGFIGPNGAGKTTTLKMLSGLLYPTLGTVRVLGYDPFLRDHTFLRQISLVMGQKQQLWWELPVNDSFLLNKEIYDIPTAQYQHTLKELMDLFEVSDIVHLPPRTLSLGQRMKCELIAALLHRPKVLFLDEPTIGLDVVMQQHLRDFVAHYNKKFGATIILTSHYMDDVKQLCERIIMINQGQLVYDGKLTELTRNHADYKVLSIVFEKPISQEAIEKFGVIELFDGSSIRIRVETKNVQHAASKILHDFPVDDINIQEPDIEEIIREIFEKRQ